MPDTLNLITQIRIPGVYDLGHLVGRTVAIGVDADPPQWVRLAQYLSLPSEGTTLLTLAEPITVPWPAPEQQARLQPPTQFRLYADVFLARRLDEPRTDDDTAVVW